MTGPMGEQGRPVVVLVHGAGGTPATWAAVSPRLQAAGYRVRAVTNPLVSLAGDVAHTRAVVDALPDPVLLVGHSYGGAVITNVGRHPRVRGLVYVAAFAPAEGETVQQIVTRYPPAPVSPFMRRGPAGEWRSALSTRYWAEIGFDLTPVQRRVAELEHRPTGADTFAQPSGQPAWRDLPSWYLVAGGDRTLRPEIQRDMAARMGATVAEVPGSHFTPLRWPDRVVSVIGAAARALVRPPW